MFKRKYPSKKEQKAAPMLATPSTKRLLNPNLGHRRPGIKPTTSGVEYDNRTNSNHCNELVASIEAPAGRNDNGTWSYVKEKRRR